MHSSFQPHLHCTSSTQHNFNSLSGTLNQWGVVELDWTPKVGSTEGTIVITYTPINSDGSEGTAVQDTYTEPSSGDCSGSEWPPNPAAAMGAFLQNELQAANTYSNQTGNVATMNVDWVEEQALS